jgi:hypothetical protein
VFAGGSNPAYQDPRFGKSGRTPMKFDMTTAWREATAMIAANREVLAVVAGIFFLLPSVGIAMAIPGTEQMVATDTKQAEAQLMAIYGQWWWLLGLTVIAQMVGTLAVLALLRDYNRPTVGEALKVGVVGLLPYIAASLILGVALVVLLGLLFSIAMAVGGEGLLAVAVIVALPVLFYTMVKFLLAGPVVAIEKVFNPVTVITRSWQLTKGNSFRLALFYFLLLICYGVISTVVVMIASALGLVLGETAALLVSALLSGLVSAFATLIFVVVIAAVHRQLAGPSEAAVNATFE